jgi:transposase
MRKIGEEITEELDLKPASLFVRRYIRPRYVSKEETFHIASLPTRPIEKGMPAAGLLSQIITDKKDQVRSVSTICLSTGRHNAMSS